MNIIDKIKNYSPKKAIITLAVLALFTGYQSQAQNRNGEKSAHTFGEVVSIAKSINEILFDKKTPAEEKPTYAAEKYLIDIDGDGAKDLVTAIYRFKEKKFGLKYKLNKNNKFDGEVKNTNYTFFHLNNIVDLHFDDIDGDGDSDIILTKHYTKDNRRETYLVENDNLKLLDQKLFDTDRINMYKPYKDRK